MNTRKSAAVLSVIAVALACCPSSGETLRMVAVAHQGFHGKALKIPGNSVPAFKAAYAGGAKWIETDVNLLKNGRLLCVHDRKVLKGQSGVDHGISTLTEEDVASIDIGKSIRSKQPVRMPYLEEVLACVPTNAFAQLELSIFGPEMPAKFDAAVKAAGHSERNILVSSGSLSSLAEFHRVNPKYRTLWLGAGAAPAKKSGKPWNVARVIEKAKAAGVDGVCPPCAVAMQIGLTPEMADQVRAAGLDFRLFGVNSPDALVYAASVRASAFTTDCWQQSFEWAKALPDVEVVREFSRQ